MPWQRFAISEQSILVVIVRTVDSVCGIIYH